MGDEFQNGTSGTADGFLRGLVWGREILRGVSDVWQTQGLETRVFGSVAILGLRGEFSDVWQGKELGLKRFTVES